MKKSNKKGFTLVELIVVIAIMAILAAVLVPTVTSKIRDANKSSANSSASAVANNVQSEIISIKSGLASTDNKYVEAGAGGAIAVKSDYSNKEGNATIEVVSYSNGAYIKVTATVSDQPATYYVSTTDGKVTTTDPAPTNPSNNGTGGQG